MYFSTQQYYGKENLNMMKNERDNSSLEMKKRLSE